MQHILFRDSAPTERILFPEVVVCDESFILDNKIISSTASYVFKEAKKVLDEDGNETYKIKYFKTYNPKEAYCSELSVFEQSGIKSGDVFVGLFNNKGEFSRMLKIYDAKTHTLDLSYYESEGISTASYSSYCYQFAGYIYFNNGTTIGVCTDDPATIIHSKECIRVGRTKKHPVTRVCNARRCFVSVLP